ncbi:MAG: hypothetical protein AB7T63_14890 [Planctomycetota bacterium]
MAEVRRLRRDVRDLRHEVRHADPRLIDSEQAGAILGMNAAGFMRYWRRQPDLVDASVFMRSRPDAKRGAYRWLESTVREHVRLVVRGGGVA